MFPSTPPPKNLAPCVSIFAETKQFSRGFGRRAPEAQVQIPGSEPVPEVSRALPTFGGAGGGGERPFLEPYKERRGEGLGPALIFKQQPSSGMREFSHKQLPGARAFVHTARNKMSPYCRFTALLLSATCIFVAASSVSEAERSADRCWSNASFVHTAQGQVHTP